MPPRRNFVVAAAHGINKNKSLRRVHPRQICGVPGPSFSFSFVLLFFNFLDFLGCPNKVDRDDSLNFLRGEFVSNNNAIINNTAQ